MQLSCCEDIAYCYLVSKKITFRIDRILNAQRIKENETNYKTNYNDDYDIYTGNTNTSSQTSYTNNSASSHFTSKSSNNSSDNIGCGCLGCLWTIIAGIFEIIFTVVWVLIVGLFQVILVILVLIIVFGLIIGFMFLIIYILNGFKL